MIRQTVTSQAEEGIGARVTAKIVQIANEFNSRVFIEIGTKKINAKSIMGMMTLQLREGEEVLVKADGADEEEALEGIENYLKSN